MQQGGDAPLSERQSSSRKLTDDKSTFFAMGFEMLNGCFPLSGGGGALGARGTTPTTQLAHAEPGKETLKQKE